MSIPVTFSNFQRDFEILTLREYFNRFRRRQPEIDNENEFRFRCINPQCRSQKQGRWFRVIKNVRRTYRSVRQHIKTFHEEDEPELAEQLPEEGEVDENNNHNVKILAENS